MENAKLLELAKEIEKGLSGLSKSEAEALDGETLAKSAAEKPAEAAPNNVVPLKQPAPKPAIPAKGSQITIQDKKINPASVNKLAAAGYKVKTVFKGEFDLKKDSESWDKPVKKCKV